jgi:hypothetical protein
VKLMMCWPVAIISYSSFAYVTRWRVLVRSLVAGWCIKLAPCV